LLKAIGWVESGWQQFTPGGLPLLSPDFGYGIMQVTSGMDGAFGRLHGSIDENSQSAIASDYQFNIAYGARILAQKWASMPRIGTGDPEILEDWYFALWAYNGWGWVNNPNNPRFARIGTPASDPASYPYQERVLYLVSHPPRDRVGNPLWKAIPVSLPGRAKVGATPHSYAPQHIHREPPPAAWAARYRNLIPSPTAGSKASTHPADRLGRMIGTMICQNAEAGPAPHMRAAASRDGWTWVSPASTVRTPKTRKRATYASRMIHSVS